jgi:hypothetical protein
MKTIRLFLGVVLLVLGLHSPATSAADKDVNVINTPNVNVVNTPSVNVGNTPNVNVTNTPGVNVLNTPTVRVSSSPTDPVVVQQVSVTPGTRMVVGDSVSLSSGNSTALAFYSIDVDVTDAIVSIQQNVGGGCRLQFLGGLLAPGVIWFDTLGGVGNGIEKFHFDPPIPSGASDPFEVFVIGTGTPGAGAHCYAGITLLGIQR